MKDGLPADVSKQAHKINIRPQFVIKGLQKSYWERERFFSYSHDRAVNTSNSNRGLIVEQKRSMNPDVTVYVWQN